jgi:N-acetylneuraminate lyase
MEMQRREFIAGAVAAGASCAVAGVEAKSRPMAAGDDPFGMAGVYTALFTPFTPDDRVDAEMVGRMVEYGLANGIKGFYLTGGTGEGLLLSKDERKLVYRTAAKAANGRAKLIAHVGCVNTNDAVELARAAADAGCDWVSSVPPVYYGQKPADVYNHYRLISEATDLPFLIYANGGVVNPETDARLFDLRNVKGMKYTGTNFYDVQRLKSRIGKEAVFFSGSDQHAIAALSFGDVFAGVIGTLQNVIPAHFVRIWNLVRANDFRAAAQVQSEANKAVEFVCHTFAKQSLRKAAMRYIGLDCGMFRPPHEPYTEAEYADFCARADKLGIFRRNQGVA